MKKLLLFLFLVSAMSEAQIVNIPDNVLKAKLLAASPFNNIAYSNQVGGYVKIDANDDGNIQLSEAQRSIRSMLVLSNPVVIQELQAWPVSRVFRTSRNSVATTTLSVWLIFQH